MIPLWISAENLGGFSGSELRYGSNAREFALAGALVAESNPGFRQFSNPALLARIESSEAGISFFRMSLDRSIQTLTYSRHLPPKAGVGLSLYRTGIDNITGRNTIGEVTETFSSSDIMGMLTFAVQFTDKLSIGLNVKILYSSLMEDINSSGLGVDVGVSYLLSDQFHFGMRATNVFGKTKWKYNLPDGTERNYSILSPKLLTAGIRYDIPENLRLLIQVDFLLLPIVETQSSGFEAGIVRSENDEIHWRIPDNGYIIRIGAEKKIKDILTLRLGLSHTNPVIGAGSEFTVWGNHKLIWDYAVDQGMNGEGISHNFSWRIEI